MATQAVSETLNSLERTQLRVAEAIIQKHLGTFMEVGKALGEIRDKRLYRETHKTFEAYVSAKWDFERRHAYRLIAASEVMENVSPGTQKTDRVAGGTLPSLTERQVRPLTELPPEKQREALAAAIEKAKEEEKPLTAALVAEVVEEFKAPSDAPPDEETQDEETLSAAVLAAINGEKIKPTPEQRKQLAAMDEGDQDAILEAVLAERQTLRQAIQDGPADPGPEEIGKGVATELDRLCRALSKIIADELPLDDPWVQEKKALIEGDLRALKNTIFSCKAVHLCPTCKGEGCKTCKQTGRVNKYTLDKVA